MTITITGPPGSGKSVLANRICNMLDDYSFFEEDKLYALKGYEPGKHHIRTRTEDTCSLTVHVTNFTEFTSLLK